MARNHYYLRLSVVVLAAALLALILTPPLTAEAKTLNYSNPRVLMIGDSLTWQSCSGAAQRFNFDAPLWLRERDGGCYGYSGATTADMAFIMQGGRFYSTDPGQPHPYLPGRGLKNPYDLREALDRSHVVVFGLGTNDSNRLVGCAKQGLEYTPWPVQIANARGSGPNPPPCQVSIAQYRQHIDYFVRLAQQKPVFWIDVAVTNKLDPAYKYQKQINAEIYAAAKRYKNFHVLSWSKVVAAHPHYLRADGVHLTDPGRAARLQMVADAVWGLGYR